MLMKLNTKLDILVALYLYLEIFCERSAEMRLGVVALETIFGFLLSGPMDFSSSNHTE